jgi:hypothetical protein
MEAVRTSETSVAVSRKAVVLRLRVVKNGVMRGTLGSRKKGVREGLHTVCCEMGRTCSTHGLDEKYIDHITWKASCGQDDNIKTDVKGMCEDVDCLSASG